MIILVYFLSTIQGTIISSFQQFPLEYLIFVRVNYMLPVLTGSSLYSLYFLNISFVIPTFLRYFRLFCDIQFPAFTTIHNVDYIFNIHIFISYILLVFRFSFVSVNGDQAVILSIIYFPSFQTIFPIFGMLSNLFSISMRAINILSFMTFSVICLVGKVWLYTP